MSQHPCVRFCSEFGDGQMALIRQNKCEQSGIYSTYLLLDECSAPPEIVTRVCTLLAGANVEGVASTGYDRHRHSYILRFRHLRPLRNARAFVKAKARALCRMIESVEVAAAWAWHYRGGDDQDPLTYDNLLLSFSTQN